MTRYYWVADDRRLYVGRNAPACPYAPDPEAVAKLVASYEAEECDGDPAICDCSYHENMRRAEMYARQARGKPMEENDDR